MAKRATRSRQKKNQSRASAGTNWLARPAFWHACAVIVGIAAIPYALGRLDTRAWTHHAPTAKIEWVGLPPWIQQEAWAFVLNEVNRDARGLSDGPLLAPTTMINDARVTAYVGENIGRSPWIESVERVTKMRDGGVRVYARFRRPVGTVSVYGRSYMIDSHGVRLPLEWGSEFGRDNGDWIAIRGIEGPIPRLGEPWRDASVQAGLDLLIVLTEAYLAEKAPFYNDVRAIDVSAYDRIDTGLRIFTRYERSPIVWGCPPAVDTDDTVEAKTNVKLATLAAIFRDFGELPDRGPKTIRFAPVVTSLTP